jgi:hypothetical protein
MVGVLAYFYPMTGGSKALVDRVQQVQWLARWERWSFHQEAVEGGPKDPLERENN